MKLDFVFQMQYTGLSHLHIQQR
uniref:Uncharacterized protein n=1 Tax=Rhizophora mucronata TaxID=61149 RepID=A0A2P2QEY8_RHIMU